MTNEKAPVLITSKGELNVAVWTKWYMAQHGVSYLRAQKTYNEIVQGMTEPALATTAGNPNPVWCAWYRLKKKVSSNVAKCTCRIRIQAIQEGKTVNEVKVWWQ